MGTVRSLIALCLVVITSIARGVIPSRSRADTRRWPAWLAVFLVAFLVHVTSPNAVVSDSMRVVPVAQSMVHRRTISLDHYGARLPVAGYGINEVDGHIYPLFPWGVSLFLVPVVAAYDAAHALGWGPGVDARIFPPDNDSWRFEVFAMSLVVALTTVLMYEVALAVLGASIEGERLRRRLALLAAAVFSFGTAAWSVASRSAWQHAPSMLFLTLAVLLAVRSRTDDRSVRWLGATLAAAYVMRPTNLVPFAAFSLWALCCHRRRLLAYGAGAAAVLIPFGAVNLRAWGTLLPPYYSGDRLGGNSHLLEALLGNLVSPARGLLLFSPVLALAAVGVWRSWSYRGFDALNATLVACVLMHWVAISTFPHWWGGDSYGPRLFSDMTPFLVVLALPALEGLVAPRPWGHRRAAVVACSVLAAWSIFVNFQGAWLRSSWCWNNVPSQVDQNPSRLWDWGDPQFLRGARRLVGGPSPRSEIIRGGVASIGCPPEDTPPPHSPRRTSGKDGA